MPTDTAAQRRAILANAHAKFFNRSNIEAGNSLMAKLKEFGIIDAEDNYLFIQKDGTTIVLILEMGERLELDAYGNTLRGAL